MTVLLTLVGVIVFIFSLFTVGFKKSFGRLLMFATTGLVLDVLIWTIIAAIVVIPTLV